MNWKKRLICIVTALSLVCMMLTGCGAKHKLSGKYESESGRYEIKFESDGDCTWYQDGQFFEVTVISLREYNNCTTRKEDARMNALIPDEQIDLQELQKRTDIAVISDEIASREELIDSLRRYLMLPRKDRRFSDYYSVRLFGCNVPDMFSTMRYRFKFESPVPVNETLFISEPDLYYNKKAFDEGSVNLCFVIGYSGSGKSVLTQDYEGEGIEKVELDDIVCIKDHYTLDELKQMGELLYSFFAGSGAKYYISREERDPFADHSEVFVKFIDFARDYAAARKSKRRNP